MTLKVIIECEGVRPLVQIKETKITPVEVALGMKELERIKHHLLSIHFPDIDVDMEAEYATTELPPEPEPLPSIDDDTRRGVVKPKTVKLHKKEAPDDGIPDVGEGRYD